MTFYYVALGYSLQSASALEARPRARNGMVDLERLLRVC